MLCCVRGQRVERMPRTLGLCDWKHIVSHFNIYDKMPVALCHSLGLYLTPNWQICQEFSPVPLPLSFFFFIFNCVFNLRSATRLFDIRAYKSIAERHWRFTTNSQRHFPIKFSAGFLEFFFALLFSHFIWYLSACVTPLYWLLSTSTALYQPQIPQSGPHTWWAYRKTQSNC